MHVLIADDQAWLRLAIRLFLEQEPGVALIREVGDVAALLQDALVAHSDLILLDWELPGLNTPNARKQLINDLHSTNPQVFVVALSGQPEAAGSALAAGVDLFVSKGGPPEYLRAALHQVQQARIGPQIVQKTRRPIMPEYELAVIGGGPAGLAATFYAMQSQLNVALVAPEMEGRVSHSFTLRDRPPTQTVWGGELVRDFDARITDSATTRISQEVAVVVNQGAGGGFQLTLADQTMIGAQTLIVATGARPQRLYIHGEKEFAGRGVSYSAISHSPFFKGRNVAVIGSGERAIGAALKLAGLAKHVYFIVARTRELGEFKLTDRLLHHPRISTFRDWEVQQIAGDEFVTGIDLMGGNGATRTLEVEGVFIQQGLLPNNNPVHDLVDLDEDGHVIVNQRCETSVPGLFAAGDVTNVYAEQVPVAVGEGVKAALSAWNYLARHG